VSAAEALRLNGNTVFDTLGMRPKLSIGTVPLAPGAPHPSLTGRQGPGSKQQAHSP
jgi:hypothetical protein